MLCRVWQCWSVGCALVGAWAVGAWAGCVGLGWSVDVHTLVYVRSVGLGHTRVCEPVREVDTKVSLCQAKAKPVHVTPEYLFKNTLVAPTTVIRYYICLKACISAVSGRDVPEIVTKGRTFAVQKGKFWGIAGGARGSLNHRRVVGLSDFLPKIQGEEREGRHEIHIALLKTRKGCAEPLTTDTGDMLLFFLYRGCL